jgi:ABC-type branched-subunit amino acid transport system permease subunit
MSFFTQLLLHPVAWYRAHELLVGQTGANGRLAFSIWLTLYSGQLTLANAGFMAIGAFTSVILTRTAWPTGGRRPSPTATSVDSRSPGRWPSNPACSCWTSRPRA